MEFIFIEDRDWETGHGWRDAASHRFEISSDGDVYVVPFFSEPDDPEDGRYGNRSSVSYSYAWICSKAYYDKHNHLEDNIRTSDIREHIPGFNGVDDMESHFEFRMNPKEMRDYLLRLGFVEVRR